MKKISFITISIATMALLVSCSKVRRNPGRVYMPDMNYSRAYETYASLDSNKFTKDPAQLGEGKIFYNSMPVAGTMAKGDMTWTYPYKNDSMGYVQSASVKNPLLDSLSYIGAKIDKAESERLYLVYCGICHGAKLDGNGPLYNGGNGPFLAAPKNFMLDDMKKMSEGTMFHSVTYGRNAMGSYASQLSTMQRWMVIDFIKNKQNAVAPPASPGGKGVDTTKQDK